MPRITASPIQPGISAYSRASFNNMGRVPATPVGCYQDRAGDAQKVGGRGPLLLRVRPRPGRYGEGVGAGVDLAPGRRHLDLKLLARNRVREDRHDAFAAGEKIRCDECTRGIAPDNSDLAVCGILADADDNRV